MNEIIVTAQKVPQRAFDVPISLVAIGEEELHRREITSIDELSNVVPGLTIESNGGWERRIIIRGVSNVFGNAALVGTYLGEADVTSLALDQLNLQTYDLKRIEVLRGPQGTLYGEGSIGGTIRFIPNDPVLSRFEMTSDISALFTQFGSPGQRIDVMLNAPAVRNGIQTVSGYCFTSDVG